jgi:hypothetical protein
LIIKRGDKNEENNQINWSIVNNSF